jgi:hypothetical protein
MRYKNLLDGLRTVRMHELEAKVELLDKQFKFTASEQVTIRFLGAALQWAQEIEKDSGKKISEITLDEVLLSGVATWRDGVPNPLEKRDDGGQS